MRNIGMKVMAAAGAAMATLASFAAGEWGVTVDRAADPSLLPVITATLPQDAEGMATDFASTPETNVTKRLLRVQLEETVEPWRGWTEVRFAFLPLKVLATWTPESGNYPLVAAYTNSAPVKGTLMSYRLNSKVEISLAYTDESGLPGSRVFTNSVPSEVVSIVTPHVRLVQGDEGMISVRRSDWTNYWPVVEVAPPAGWQSAAIEMAPAAEGPWVEVKTWSAADGAELLAYTNEAALVGINNFYRLKSSFADAQSGETTEKTSGSVAFRRLRLLERDWSDMTKLRDGVDIIPPANIEATNTVKRLFDNDDTTHADVPRKTINFAGLDFNETVHVGAYRYFIANLGFDGHNKHIVWGGVNREFSGAPVQICNKWTIPYCTYPVMGQWVDEERIDDAVAQTDARCIKVTYGGTVIYNSELQFYGWTETDERAAGKPILGKAIVVERAADGVRISWPAGASCTEYRIERRTPANETGTQVWTLVGTTDGLEFIDPDGLELASLYRVSGWNASFPVGSYSDSKFYYPAASGAGLMMTVKYPFANGVENPAQIKQLESRIVANPGSIVLAAGERLAQSAPEEVTSCLVHLTGKLTIPAPGNYEFRLRGSGRMAAFMDNWLLADRWNATGYGNVTASKKFTAAGEHEIEIAFNDANPAKDREYLLEWAYEGGEYEVIPGGQFTPAAEPLTEQYGEWTGFRLALTKYGAARPVANEANAFRFFSGDDPANGDVKWCREFPGIYREAEGDFEIVGYADHREVANGCYVRLLAHDGEGNAVTLNSYYRNGAHTLSRSSIPTPQTKTLALPAVTNGNVAATMWLKLERKADAFILSAKRMEIDDWKVLETYKPESRISRKLYVGVGGSCQWGYDTNRKTPIVHNLGFRSRKRGLAILIQ